MKIIRYSGRVYVRLKVGSEKRQYTDLVELTKDICDSLGLPGYIVLIETDVFGYYMYHVCKTKLKEFNEYCAKNIKSYDLTFIGYEHVLGLMDALEKDLRDAARYTFEADIESEKVFDLSPDIQDKKEKGFTLIEFMIIAVTLGIIAAVAIPMCSDYETVKKDRERGIDTESVEYKEWLNMRMMGEEYQVPSRKKSRTKHMEDAAEDGTSYANPWTHPETGFTCDLKELNCNVLREQYMGRKKNE
ncbi:MAG: prepilin-type N-terminal cleavage/methylation domain-containing protein [Synergistaceae bacterium]|jgi:Tfp pilus assembly major pilin PilA